MSITGGIRALAAVAATLAVTLAQLNLPRGFWPRQDPILYGSVAVLVVIGLHEGLGSAAQLSQAARVRDYERNIRAVLGAGLSLVVTETGCAWDSIGVHVFRSRYPWRLCLLVNIGGIRLGSKPSMQWPMWKPGKGVVGKAWSTGSHVAVDWRSFYTSANLAGRAAWTGLSPDDRYRLSWGELQLTSDYVSIAACPIFDSGGQQIGCVVIDLPVSHTDLLKPRVREIMRDVATAVHQLGTPPVTWWKYRSRW